MANDKIALLDVGAAFSSIPVDPPESNDISATVDYKESSVKFLKLDNTLKCQGAWAISSFDNQMTYGGVSIDRLLRIGPLDSVDSGVGVYHGLFTTLAGTGNETVTYSWASHLEFTPGSVIKNIVFPRAQMIIRAGGAVSTVDTTFSQELRVGLIDFDGNITYIGDPLVNSNTSITGSFGVVELSATRYDIRNHVFSNAEGVVVEEGHRLFMRNSLSVIRNSDTGTTAYKSEIQTYHPSQFEINFE